MEKLIQRDAQVFPRETTATHAVVAYYQGRNPLEVEYFFEDGRLRSLLRCGEMPNSLCKAALEKVALEAMKEAAHDTHTG